MIKIEVDIHIQPDRPSLHIRCSMDGDGFCHNTWIDRPVDTLSQIGGNLSFMRQTCKLPWLQCYEAEVTLDRLRGLIHALAD